MQLFGLIIGTILGYASSIVIIDILQKIIKNAGETIFFEETNVPFTINFPIYLIILVAVIIYIIVFISVLLPLSKVKKLNIIDEVKGLYKSKSKKQKVPFFIRKVFKQEGIIAYKYNKCEKAKHTTIVFSLTLSVCIFLVVNGIIINFLKSVNQLTYDDYALEIPSESINDVIDYLEGNNLMNGYFIQTKGFQIAMPENSSIFDLHIEVPKEKISNTVSKILEESNINYTNENYKYTLISYYLNEDAYQDILKKVGINELRENECILINTQKIENSTFGDSFDITKYKIRR